MAEDTQKQPAVFEFFRHDKWVFGIAAAIAGCILYISAMEQIEWLSYAAGAVLFAISITIVALYLLRIHRDNAYPLFRYDIWIYTACVFGCGSIALAGLFLGNDSLHSLGERLMAGCGIILIVVLVYQWRKDKKADRKKEIETLKGGA